jgi:hypothetical protein
VKLHWHCKKRKEVSKVQEVPAAWPQPRTQSRSNNCDHTLMHANNKEGERVMINTIPGVVNGVEKVVVNATPASSSEHSFDLSLATRLITEWRSRWCR